jgi:hypothetical protein
MQMTRRLFSGLLGAMLTAPHTALASGRGWVEVIGAAHVTDAADLPAARRRALADALLSAALAGGAEVRGHSAMSMTRMSSDLMVMRPTGQVLEHRVLSEQLDSQLLRLRVAARVGQPRVGECPERRRLVVTAYPPRIDVSPDVPAWADALAGQVADDLMARAAGHPAMAQLVSVDRLPPSDPARDGFDYLQLTRGSTRVQAGGHALQMVIQVRRIDRSLNMAAALRLDGPAGESFSASDVQALRLPGPSLLGSAAAVTQPDRHRMAARLSQGAAPALAGLLERAACQPVLERLRLVSGRLTLPVGRAQGLMRTSIGFTVDPDRSTELLEVVVLGDRSAELAPLDPRRPKNAFDGRPVRFVTIATGLP